MSEELGKDEIGGTNQIFASAQYYFPILICTRKEESKKPGELRYDTVGIPYVLDLDPPHGKVSSLLYEQIEKPIRLKLPGPGLKCTQYYHGQCFNALLKLAAKCDVEAARNLLESHKKISKDILDVVCTCGKAHRSNSIVANRDCFGASALNIVVRMVTQLAGENRTKMIHLCQVLLNYGASPNLVPSNQIGVLDVVVENGDMELIKLLVTGGAHITTCVERIAKNRLLQPSSKRYYKNAGHDNFDLSHLSQLLSEEVLVCAPDPLVSSFYVCVVLGNLRKQHHVFSEELKSVQTRLELFTYHYLDLCKNTWEARALVTKEVLSSAGGNRIPMYEYAVMCDQKHFCSHKYIQSLAEGMWYGTAHQRGQNYTQMLDTWFSTILVNITFPLWFCRMYLLKKEISAYTLEHKVLSIARLPSVCLWADVVNHVTLIALFIRSCSLDNFDLSGIEVFTWLACLCRLIIEFDFMKARGLKRYFNDRSNIVNIAVGCTFITSILAWIVSVALPEKAKLKIHLIMVTRYIYGLAASGLLIRLTGLLRINKTLGPLTRTIVKMLHDFMTFVILLVITMVVFSLPLHTISYQSYRAYLNIHNQSPEMTMNENFDTFWNSFSFLAFSVFGYGSRRAGTLTYDEQSSFLMNIIYMVFLVGLIILMLNLLIAVLNTTFSSCQENARKDWKFSRVEQLLKYTGVQPFMFPFIIYLYPLYKLTLYGAKYIGEKESKKDSLVNRARDDFHDECVRQNFLLHKKLKQKYKELKLKS